MPTSSEDKKNSPTPASAPASAPTPQPTARSLAQVNHEVKSLFTDIRQFNQSLTTQPDGKKDWAGISKKIDALEEALPEQCQKQKETLDDPSKLNGMIVAALGYILKGLDQQNIQNNFNDQMKELKDLKTNIAAHRPKPENDANTQPLLTSAKAPENVQEHTQSLLTAPKPTHKNDNKAKEEEKTIESTYTNHEKAKHSEAEKSNTNITNMASQKQATGLLSKGNDASNGAISSHIGASVNSSLAATPKSTPS
jgi:hypothetical protein